ncbi:MAG TPA: 2-oxoacid:acceptor oxidoreductase family protein [archaeon]|jgi:2-oxoacid:acceptor oxidoreductase gamma subunit (pyruvate/2-ketoisovalerate family)|nr:2-oxoacid:acceptor oxidoreductase family protein [archaeon]
MYKIRIHGRGGQGAKKAAKIIGLAAFRSGKQVQDFALYGAERRGAPVMSFVRIDDEPILERGYVNDPDVVIVLDRTLLDLVRVEDGLNKNGLLIINSEHEPKVDTPASVKYIDATDIALETIGKPIFNTAMLGALAKLTDVITLDALNNAIEEEFSDYSEKIIKSNKAAVQKCYEMIE